MASRASFSDDSRLIKKTMPNSLLLRDYLLDDMSSCSSNGFRSYPRRQCCTTVRFLVEKDINRNGKLHLHHHRRSIVESKTKWKPKQLSVLQRASAVIVNAFKFFPFSVGGIPTKANFLPRSLSRKLLKHNFLKKTEHCKKDIKRLKSFGELIKEKETTPPPSPSPSQFSTVVTTTTTAELNSFTSNSNTWSDSEFTATTGTSEFNLAQKDIPDYSPKNQNTTNGKEIGPTTSTATTTATNYSSTSDNAKKWQKEQDEQFSPVSVMDFPRNDDNDVDDEDKYEVSSVFQYKHLDVEGTKKVMYKTRRFDGVINIEPVKLENRLAQVGLESFTQTCYEVEREEDQHEKKSIALLQLMKSTISSHELFKYEIVESMLLGFFKESMIEQNVSDYEMLQTSKDWMDGKVQQMTLDWESKNDRETCVRETEKGLNWSNYDHEVEKENVGFELEHEIFTSLVDDILLDLDL